MFLKDQPFSKMAPPIAKSWIRHCPPQTPLGELTTLPQTPYSVGTSCLRQSPLRTFGACNFPNSNVPVSIPHLLDRHASNTLPQLRSAGDATGHTQLRLKPPKRKILVMSL